jgi:exonuclease III
MLGTLLNPTLPRSDRKSGKPSLRVEPIDERKKTLKLASLNCQIIYGREKNVAKFMKDQEIDILGMQELKYYANLPPQGLPAGTILQEHSQSGIRGLSFSISPAWQQACTIPQMPNTDPDYAIWLKIDINTNVLYLCNAYLPPPRNQKDMIKYGLALEQIAADIKLLPQSSLVILLGDYNADPHPRKWHGRPVRLLSNFLQLSKLVLAPRSQLRCYTRVSSKHHVDHFFITPPVSALLSTVIEYHHDHNIRRNCTGKPTDHSPITLSLNATPTKVPLSKMVRRFMVQKLRDGTHVEDYRTTLNKLLEQYNSWMSRLVANTPGPLPRPLLRILWAALMFIVDEAAYIALGTKATPSTIRGIK